MQYFDLSSQPNESNKNTTNRSSRLNNFNVSLFGMDSNATNPINSLGMSIQDDVSGNPFVQRVDDKKLTMNPTRKSAGFK